MNFWKNTKIKQLGEFLLNHRLVLVGLIIGSLGGYLYYYFVGCAGGTCLITSRPLPSTLYGALMGALLFDMFRNNKSKSELNSKSESI